MLSGCLVGFSDLLRNVSVLGQKLVECNKTPILECSVLFLVDYEAPIYHRLSGGDDANNQFVNCFSE